MGIGPQDHIDELLVDKYKDSYTINVSNFSTNPINNYNTIFSKLETFLDNANYAYTNYCYSDSYSDNEDDNMNNIFEEDTETNFENPNIYYQNLGVDTLSIQIGEGLIVFTENMIMPQVAELRQDLTENLGYIIPNVRILVNTGFKNNEYRIYVRDKEVFQSKVELTEEDDITCIAVYSIATNEIIKNLERICIEYAEKIICKTDIIKLMELVRSQDPTLVNDLIPVFISAIDLKKIIVNLIKQHISIKDILMVFESLNDHARNTQNLKILTDKLKNDLSF